MVLVTKENCLATKNKKLASEWHPVKNGELIPYNVTLGSGRKIWWKCLVCDHEWEAVIKNRNRGHGCPACAGRVATKQNCLATKNKKLAKEWHPTKNGKLTPYNVTSNFYKKIWWKCPVCSYEWKTTVCSRRDGSGCPACSGLVVTKQNNLFIKNKKLASEWHPNKNGKLTPYDVTTSSCKKFWWKCPDCDHEWKMRVVDRKGCPGCYGRVATKYNCLAVKNKKLASEWHPNKNGKLTPYNVTPGSDKKIWWKCPICDNEWESIVAGRNNGNGCPGCFKQATKQNCLSTKNKKVASEWHPNKNGKFTPYNVAAFSNKKIWWKCPVCDHEWEAIVASRSNGHFHQIFLFEKAATL